VCVGGSDRRSLRAVKVSRAALVGLGLFIVVAWLLTDAGIVPLLVAALVAGILLKVGVAMLRGLATPVPAPPPAGELRKVRLTYRCSLCGTEVRMTTANDEVPEPPRHCMEDMELVATADDLL
jgi:hypothetical protein